MALTTYTITITNQNTDPKVINGSIDTTVISPTGITTPQTPYDEYISDSTTVGTGVVSVPLYPKFQPFALKASSILTLVTENSNEAAYYSNLTLDGALVEVSTDPVQTISVTFDKTTAAITGTGTASITATTNPAGQTVTWTSSDESVATVSSGTVTGVAAGTAVITGTVTYKGVTAIATCAVTVS